MDYVERTISYFQQGYSCSQAIVASFGCKYGLEKETGLRLASPFAGGVGCHGATCGALIGAMLIIGLAAGTSSPDKDLSQTKAIALTRELFIRFKNAYKWTDCSQLLGIRMDDPVALSHAGEQGIIDNRCPAIVRDTAHILKTLLTTA